MVPVGMPSKQLVQFCGRFCARSCFALPRLPYRSPYTKEFTWISSALSFAAQLRMAMESEQAPLAELPAQLPAIPDQRRQWR